MLRKGWLAKQIWAQIVEIRYYNKYGKREMIARNTVALRVISVLSLFLTVIFFAGSFFIEKWNFTWHFWPLLALFAVTAYVSFFGGKQIERNYVTSQMLGALFHVFLAVALIILGVFYYNDRPSVIFCAFLIVVPVFFTAETWIVATITTFSGVAFCIITTQNKAPEVAASDVFSAVLGMVLSHIVLGYFARLRAKSFIARRKYVKLSRTDLLTGILNKRSYEQWCQKLLDEREQNEPCALAVFDLDNFKQINDTYGHMMGDKVLEIVGQTLAVNFPMGGLAGRIGGDEFSAFVCTRGGCEMFARRAENVLSEVKERAKKELKIDVTMSMGVTVEKGGNIGYMDMYFDADKALYASKRTLQNERCPVLVR